MPCLDTTRFDPSVARTPQPLDLKSDALTTRPPRSPLKQNGCYIKISEFLIPFACSSLSPAFARDPLTFNLSDTTDGVINL